jgi:hypothetical protein
MNKLDHLIPKIKRNLNKFDKPGVLFVRPGYCVEHDWPTHEEAIVAVTSQKAGKIKLPAKIDGTSVEVRRASDLEQFSHDKPSQFSQLADHRAEFRGGGLTQFAPAQASVRPNISADVSTTQQKKAPIQYVSASIPLTPVTGNIAITCHVSPDAGWAELQKFIGATKSKLKVSMYDFTSEHILELFEQRLVGKTLRMTLDDPPLNPTADHSDIVTVADLKAKIAKNFTQAWALVRSSPEADTWMFPTAYHIKVMVRDSNTLWLSSGNLNNSNQPKMDPIGNPLPTDQATAKKSDRDWHVIVESPDLAKIFEAYLDADLAQATLHAAAGPVAAKKKPAAKKNTPVPKLGGIGDGVAGDFTFVAAKTIQELVTITPLLTPDAGDYQGAMLNLINSVQTSLYIQLQYIRPGATTTAEKFTELLDALGAKINAGKDVRIILSEFQVLKGGLEALQGAGINLANVRIQNNVHNKGFVFDHKKVVVSSMNWSGEGVLENRDAGVLIENATAAQYFEAIFLDDWSNHAKQKMPAPSSTAGAKGTQGTKGTKTAKGAKSAKRIKGTKKKT